MVIYLIGFMGCGKTTLAGKLAEALGFEAIDLDRFIEERNFKSVPALFEVFGEKHFRHLERKALEEVAQFSNVVVSTGGGAPCFFDNMEFMNNSGITVYLETPVEILAQRLLRSKTDRPLIRGKQPGEIEITIREMLEQRSPYYQKARLVVQNREQPLNDVLDALRKSGDISTGN